MRLALFTKEWSFSWGRDQPLLLPLTLTAISLEDC
jgi:hypothetical protein